MTSTKLNGRFRNAGEEEAEAGDHEREGRQAEEEEDLAGQITRRGLHSQREKRRMSAR